jgi:uncharacterized protein
MTLFLVDQCESRLWERRARLRQGPLQAFVGRGLGCSRFSQPFLCWRCISCAEGGTSAKYILSNLSRLASMAPAALMFTLALLMPLNAGPSAFAELQTGVDRPNGDTFTECDRLAASPFDDDRKSMGVEFVRVDASRAIPVCAGAANLGSIQAMAHLARAYRRKGDYNEALRWFEKAASAGSAMGITGLGFLYERGDGVAQDLTKARELWEKAAAMGNTLAMANLGGIFAGGRGVPQDYPRAREWYEKGAQKDNAMAMVALGTLYRDGKGVPQDYAKARSLFEMAVATSDFSGAMYALGALYRDGKGVPRDYTKAREWFQKAAAKDNVMATAALALLYLHGQGVSKDDAKARDWMEKAAKAVRAWNRDPASGVIGVQK